MKKFFSRCKFILFFVKVGGRYALKRLKSALFVFFDKQQEKDFHAF